MFASCKAIATNRWASEGKIVHYLHPRRLHSVITSSPGSERLHQYPWLATQIYRQPTPFRRQHSFWFCWLHRPIVSFVWLCCIASNLWFWLIPQLLLVMSTCLSAELPFLAIYIYINPFACIMWDNKDNYTSPCASAKLLIRSSINWDRQS